MLQYITNSQSEHPIEEQVKAVLEGGCRWILLRMDNTSEQEVLDMAKRIKPLTDEKKAFLIINKYVNVCRDANATGVHLEDVSNNSMSPSKARMELGPLAVIGVTASSFDEISKVRALDIDYITLSPFDKSLTSNFKCLSLDDIKSICRQMDAEEINIAHVAAGNIEIEDIKPLLEAGCNGLAISNAITNSNDMTKITKEICEMLPTGD